MRQKEKTYREGLLESRNDVTCSEMLIVPGFKNDNNHFIRILSAEVNHTKDKKKQNGNKTQDL